MKQPRRWTLAVVTLLPFLLVDSAFATIVGGEVTGGTSGGTFVKLAPPLPNPLGPANSVGNDTFQSPNLFGFDEDQNVVLVAPLTVDVGSSPLNADTIVASHYVFFDPGPDQSVVGTVNFDADVLAIITSTSNLANSDFLANTGINYLSPALRGLEAGDAVTISGARQISFDVTAGTPGDYVRVLTVPEPAALVLMGLGIAGMGLVGWRRRRTVS